MAGRPNAELFVEWKTGVPMALADTNLSTFMISGSSAAPGLVPAPPLVAGAVLFLREDGVWAAAAPGTASVTNAMLATMAEATFKGRAAGAGAGAPQDLTASEATAILNIFVSASAGKKGLVPAPTTADVGKVLGATGWENPSGGLTKLNSGTITASTSSVAFNIAASYSGYSEIYIQFYGLLPTTNGDGLACQFSSNGTTYTSASYDYAYNLTGAGAANTPIGAGAGTGIVLTGSVINTSGKAYNGKMYIIEPSSTGLFPRIMHQGAHSANAVSPQNRSVVGSGMLPTSMAVGGVIFYFLTSTFASGRWTIYGYS